MVPIPRPCGGLRPFPLPVVPPAAPSPGTSLCATASGSGRGARRCPTQGQSRTDECSCLGVGTRWTSKWGLGAWTKRPGGGSCGRCREHARPQRRLRSSLFCAFEEDGSDGAEGGQLAAVPAHPLRDAPLTRLGPAARSPPGRGRAEEEAQPLCPGQTRPAPAASTGR